MTDKGYDPFGYGQVKLAAQKGPGAESPEDLLFAPTTRTEGHKEPRSEARDASWDPPPAETLAGGAASVDFGADILGERNTTASGVRRAAAPATKAAAVAAPAIGKAAAKANGPQRGAEVQAPAPARAVGAAERRGPVIPVASPIAMTGPRQRPVVAPLLVLVAGGTGAAWLQFGRQNPVMAGIAAALTLGIAGIVWFGLER